MPKFPIQSDTGDPLLLTPGPLTTSRTVKQAMVHDWGSRDPKFVAMNQSVLDSIAALAGDGLTCVPMQGSGTFAVEAMIGTFVPRDGKMLILVNGAYGQRAAKIAKIAGREFAVLETPEDVPPNLDHLAQTLAEDSSITHVFAVHCETTSGILNPIQGIAETVQGAKRKLLVDSMSAFGAIPIDVASVPFDALAASSNKCLEGVPGLGFVICKPEVLEGCAGNAHALTLDLADQYKALVGNGQYRFTPPIHVIAALDQAVREHDEEGGVAGRHTRYSTNCRTLVEGMRSMGFETLLPDELQAPIIITFKMPKNPAFQFQRFYDALAESGFLIYPGKLTVADSFRMGCIGRLDQTHMQAALDAVQSVLADMGVSSGVAA